MIQFACIVKVTNGPGSCLHLESVSKKRVDLVDPRLAKIPVTVFSSPRYQLSFNVKSARPLKQNPSKNRNLLLLERKIFVKVKRCTVHLARRQ